MTYNQLRNSIEKALNETPDIYTPKGWWWKKYFKKYQMDKYLTESLIISLWERKWLDQAFVELPYEFVEKYIPERLDDWVRLKKLKYGIVSLNS